MNEYSTALDSARKHLDAAEEQASLGNISMALEYHRQAQNVLEDARLDLRYAQDVQNRQRAS
jgi:hypothetical protein